MNKDTLNHANWSTRDEARFLLSIGKNLKNKRSRFDMLLKYKSCMKHRDNWGDIDKNWIEKFVDRELEKINSENNNSTKKLDKVERTQGRRYIPKVLAS